jgi:hypothetical protein
MTPAAAHLAAFQKDGRAYAGPVMNAKPLNIKNYTAFQF